MPHRAPAHAETADDNAAVSNVAPAAANNVSANAQKPDESKLDFEVVCKSKNRKCRAVGCPKVYAQQSDGFCRYHHSRYLVCTDQCRSWECLCGDRMPDFLSRCGKCRKWRGGKRPKKQVDGEQKTVDTAHGGATLNSLDVGNDSKDALDAGGSAPKKKKWGRPKKELEATAAAKAESSSNGSPPESPPGLKEPPEMGLPSESPQHQKKRKRQHNPSQGDAPLFQFDVAQEQFNWGRPKRRIKAICPFDPTYRKEKKSDYKCKIGEGFACPRCETICAYDSRQCEGCQLDCCYEAGVGVVVVQERRIDYTTLAKAKKRPASPEKKRPASPIAKERARAEGKGDSEEKNAAKTDYAEALVVAETTDVGGSSESSKPSSNDREKDGGKTKSSFANDGDRSGNGKSRVRNDAITSVGSATKKKKRGRPKKKVDTGREKVLGEGGPTEEARSDAAQAKAPPEAGAAALESNLKAPPPENNSSVPRSSTKAATMELKDSGDQSGSGKSAAANRKETANSASESGLKPPPHQSSGMKGATLELRDESETTSDITPASDLDPLRLEVAATLNNKQPSAPSKVAATSNEESKAPPKVTLGFVDEMKKQLYALGGKYEAIVPNANKAEKEFQDTVIKLELAISQRKQDAAKDAAAFGKLLSSSSSGLAEIRKTVASIVVERDEFHRKAEAEGLPSVPRFTPNYSTKIDALQDRMARLSRDCEGAKKRVQELLGGSEDMESSDMVQLYRQIESLKREQSQAMHKTGDMAMEQADLTRKISATLVGNVELRRADKQQKERIAELERENASVVAEKNAAVAEKNAAVVEKEAAVAKTKTLEETVSELRGEIERLQSRKRRKRKP